VRGTLWLDDRSFELRELTFALVGVPAAVRHGEPNGHVAFARLPNGLWYLSAWAIRTAARAADAPGSPPRAGAHPARWREEGGRTLVGAAIPRAPAGRAALAGVLFDSTGLASGGSVAPLAGARVVAVGPAAGGLSDAAVAAEVDTSLAATSAVDGSFRLTVPADAAGEREFVVRAPRLDSLGVPALRLRAALVPDYETVVTVAVPSVERLRARRCGDAGGSACSAGALAAHPAPQGAVPSVVTGTVRDSLRGGPLAGATVQLVPVGTPAAPGRVAATDTAGRFRLDSVLPGRYLVGFVHARLDALGLEPPTRVVEVRPGAGEVWADLAVPGAAAVIASVCGARSDSAGVLIGQVLDAGDGAPAAAGSVVVRWGEVVADRRGVRREVRERRAAVGAGGRYAVCGVPGGSEIAVQALVPAAVPAAMPAAMPTAGPASVARHAAHVDAAASGEVEVDLPAGGAVVERDLWVDVSAARDAESPGSATASSRTTDPRGAGALAAGPGAAVARGTAGLAGRVRDADGRPLAGARVVVRVGPPRRVPSAGGAAGGRAGNDAGNDAGAPSDPVAVTDADGAYRLAGLPAGTRAVAVFALGYTPARATVDLRPGRVTAADFAAGAGWSRSTGCAWSGRGSTRRASTRAVARGDSATSPTPT
jgi:hypothetical protein